MLFRVNWHMNVKVVNGQLEITVLYCQLTVHVCSCWFVNWHMNVLVGSSQLTNIDLGLYLLLSIDITISYLLLSIDVFEWIDQLTNVTLKIVCQLTQMFVHVNWHMECPCRQRTTWDYFHLLSINNCMFVHWCQCSFISIAIWILIKVVKGQLKITVWWCQLIIICMSTEENVLSCQLTYECQSCQWPTWDYCTLLSIDSSIFVNWRKCSFMSIDMWNVKLVKLQVAITFRPCQLIVACLSTDGNVCPCQLIYGML